jgi:hypothetical protein
VSCDCCKKAKVAVHKDSLQYHGCVKCKLKVDLKNTDVCMLSCRLHEFAKKEHVGGQSVCSKCMWDNVMWGGGLYVEISKIPEEHRSLLLKNRKKQELDTRPTLCPFC